jgi:hypothetical protein
VTLHVFLVSPHVRLDLADVDNFRSLKVVFHGEGSDGSRLAEALKPVGRVVGDSTFLSIQELKRMAGARAEDPEWLAQFDSMITHARSKGWVDEDGEALEAHWERAQ